MRGLSIRTTPIGKTPCRCSVYSVTGAKVILISKSCLQVQRSFSLVRVARPFPLVEEGGGLATRPTFTYMCMYIHAVSFCERLVDMVKLNRENFSLGRDIPGYPTLFLKHYSMLYKLQVCNIEKSIHCKQQIP